MPAIHVVPFQYMVVPSRSTTRWPVVHAVPGVAVTALGCAAAADAALSGGRELAGANVPGVPAVAPVEATPPFCNTLAMFGAIPMPRSVRGETACVKDRSVMELMILTFTAVVALFILGAGGAIAIIEIRDPSVDTSVAAQALLSVVTAILGALLGVLAGRSETLRKPPKPPKEDDDAG